ncbi:unnamed protein product [Adineta ricciae]|uniref:Apple domain-containing protein n=1 Tax=Adineta ricciae TaxID=249248 RepID=A0A816A172_ADIRI|nr:unnamed protein product [Adineta ricciae]
MFRLRPAFIVLIFDMLVLNSSIRINKLSSCIYIPLSWPTTPSALFTYSSSCEECLCYKYSSTSNSVAMNCLTNIPLCQFYSNYANNYSIVWNSTSDFYFFQPLPSMITTPTMTSTPPNPEIMSTDVTIPSAVSTTSSTSYQCGNMTVLIGYDFYGNDLALATTPDYIACCHWCQSNSSCTTFTWVVPTGGGTSSTCYLKTSHASPSNDSRLVSAYK